LRALREEHPSFIFHIAAAGGERLVESPEDLDLFCDDLALMSFLPPSGGEAFSGAAPGDLYIFSTACDTGLPSFLASRSALPSYVHVTLSSLRGGSRLSRAGSGEDAALHLGDMFGGGFIPAPPFTRGEKSLFLESVPAPSKGRIEINYAEIRL
jgi:hypothetical protein